VDPESQPVTKLPRTPNGYIPPSMFLRAEPNRCRQTTNPHSGTAAQQDSEEQSSNPALPTQHSAYPLSVDSIGFPNNLDTLVSPPW